MNLRPSNDRFRHYNCLNALNDFKNFKDTFKRDLAVKGKL